MSFSITRLSIFLLLIAWFWGCVGSTTDTDNGLTNGGSTTDTDNGIITGFVHDSQGNPAEGWEVKIRPYHYVPDSVSMQTWQAGDTVTTGPDGRFEIDQDSASQYLLEIRKNDTTRIFRKIDKLDDSLNLGKLHFQPIRKYEGELSLGSGDPFIKALLLIPGTDHFSEIKRDGKYHLGVLPDSLPRLNIIYIPDSTVYYSPDTNDSPVVGETPCPEDSVTEDSVEVDSTNCRQAKNPQSFYTPDSLSDITIIKIVFSSEKNLQIKREVNAVVEVDSGETNSTESMPIPDWVNDCETTDQISLNDSEGSVNLVVDDTSSEPGCEEQEE